MCSQKTDPPGGCTRRPKAVRKIVIAVCTFNRADKLPRLINALRLQACPIPCEILVVNNNSTDDTATVVQEFAEVPGHPLRLVTETAQGIVNARNRAIEESLQNEFLAFIDDDELPGQGWINAAVDALSNEKADCVGGKIIVDLSGFQRPKWLESELLNFLGKVDNGQWPFWIIDRTTPVWSGNVAYRTSVFSGGLRFDHRYNREGHAIGGGSDEIMFKALLEQKARIRYRPDMAIFHLVEKQRLKKSYFIRLHYKAGWKEGRWQLPHYQGRTVLGVPLFLPVQALKHWLKTLKMAASKQSGDVRQAMTSAYVTGMISGRLQKWKQLR